MYSGKAPDFQSLFWRSPAFSNFIQVRLLISKVYSGEARDSQFILERPVIPKVYSDDAFDLPEVPDFCCLSWRGPDSFYSGP